MRRFDSINTKIIGWYKACNPISVNVNDSTTKHYKAMTLVQYPTRFRSNLSPVINQLFNDFLRTDGGLSHNRSLVPAANIKETEAAFLIELAVPGLKKEDFHIQIEENLLRVSANVQTEKENTDGASTAPVKVHRREFNFQSFERSFRLPKSADGDKIAATYTDGVLYLNIPKREEAKPKAPRTIQIA